MDSDFEDEIKALMDAQLDSDTICDVEKSDLQELKGLRAEGLKGRRVGCARHQWTGPLLPPTCFVA